MQELRIVFFDGYCNLCNGSVDLCIRFMKPNKLKFASLQSETAKELLTGKYNLDNPDSIVFYENGKIQRESDAALAICKFLKFPFPIFRVFKVLPKGFRDSVYRWIARNRYKWFGKKETCRLPTPEEEKFFLP